MNFKQHIARLLISLIFFAIAFSLYFEPSSTKYTPEQTLGIVVIIQIAAIIVGSRLGRPGAAATLFQTIFIAGATSFFLVFFLQPKNVLTYDQTLLDIFIIEVAGLIFSRILVRK